MSQFISTPYISYIQCVMESHFFFVSSFSIRFTPSFLQTFIVQNVAIHLDTLHIQCVMESHFIFCFVVLNSICTIATTSSFLQTFIYKTSQFISTRYNSYIQYVLESHFLFRRSQFDSHHRNDDVYRTYKTSQFISTRYNWYIQCVMESHFYFLFRRSQFDSHHREDVVYRTKRRNSSRRVTIRTYNA